MPALPQIDPWLIAQLEFWLPIVVIGITSPAAALHALLNKRDPRGALGWIAVSIFFPYFGPLLYYVFGINRVRIRARQLDQLATHGLGTRECGVDSDVTRHADAVPDNFAGLVAAADRLTGAPLVAGNNIRALHNGEQAYPAMLAAIEGAQQFVYLTTYIFETNRAGKRFMAVLAAAAKRGVEVRVLLDGFGEYYAWPRRRVGGRLRRRGVRVARFLAPRLLPPSLRLNLRNHRKILVVDGEVAFTGGMNIGDRHYASSGRPSRRVADMHFSLRGPVVRQIEEVFLGDWAFVTGERTDVSDNAAENAGPALCRAVEDGPIQDADRLATLLLAAVASARKRVYIVTPYFLPARELVGALQAAALRGLDVSIVLPGRNNLPYVDWASRHGLAELLNRGVKVYYRPAPFAHTKLFVVDDAYALIGSANIDPRSLRLNFELGVEVFESEFVGELVRHVQNSITEAERYTEAQIDQRGMLRRVRDSLAWLLSPYL